MSQLWAKIGMGFREYLKCQKKRKVGLSMGQRKMSQLWVKIGMGFKEYHKYQNNMGQLWAKIRSQQ
jgi:hypothetical protein